MDYLYENLGDERFQEFCSGLIAKEFGDFQAFPVGQPDGGRDSLVYLMNSTKKDFIVFQVKFVRDPASIKDVHKWLTNTIEEEAPKIDKLIPRGAKKFYLLTNVRGTAHLNTGSKDKVNSILESNIKIPSLCWWRDDLSRLFEKDPLFKWSFPEIISGQDVINSVLFQHINENKERRENVIQAYLADQYFIDNKVKFKQIDLDNKLFDLFTDVPLKIRKYNEKNRSIKRTLYHFENFQRRIVSVEDNFIIEDRENIGAAFFLLHPKIQNEIGRVLLEGGPGQGKSTISQYICQVHRVRLLNKVDDLELLADNIKHTPVRLPFKIDLRHIASWVDKKNPYKERLNSETFNAIWKGSLESFLVGHIIYHSQVDEFDSSDLLALTKLSPVLFVFDGFDEIADTKIREEIIELINKGVNRISENCKSIQVVITSRPAAFSDTLGFSIDQYPHFELTDITPSITTEYVDKWIKASRLDPKEGSEIKRLVKEKLKMPHLKELAKSPMQLAIFISLLRTRGESLPNKRTALYDSYIELFFNRESEKSVMIRNHRDLIVDIHQYLAWVLHSETELLNNSGSIHIDDLKSRLHTYLTNEGHVTDIADNLFHVMEERVCALVSRVQGTYEFEVQPLREYFCAKYLYNTSPYSPAGAEKMGTKPERFDAIARNFYWHNVVRFFAGCFDKGELPMLIQKLKELQDDTLLKNTNYPRLLTSQILSDWVFTQYPLLLKDVVQIIVDGINIGGIINQEGRIGRNEPILLPHQCGRTELTEECFTQLKKFPNTDYAYELISILNNNPYNTLENWLNGLEGLSGKKLTQWIEYAYSLEILYKVQPSVLDTILSKGSLSQKESRLQILIRGNCLDKISSNPVYKKIIFNGILKSEIFVYKRKYIGNSLFFLTYIFHPNALRRIFEEEDSNVDFITFISKNGYIAHDNREKKSIKEFPIVDKIDESIARFRDQISEVTETMVKEWKYNLHPWNLLVESLRSNFNDNWSSYILAVTSAGIKSKSETYDDFTELTDDTKSLCKRVRCARMKSGNIKYWDEQLKTSNNLTFTLLVMLTWATPKTLIQLAEPLEDIVKTLTDVEYSILTKGLSRTSFNTILSPQKSVEMDKFFSHKKFLPELIYLISYRLHSNGRWKFIDKNIGTEKVRTANIKEIRLTHLIRQYINDSKNNDLLMEIKDMYSSIDYFNEKQQYFNYFMFDNKEMPIHIANSIMSESRNFPRIIASIAERACRRYANENVKMVGQIAKDEKWFEQ